ncbi:ankyrin repeat domain-containing protein [Streptomyces sp. NBC_01465]|uniref:ankyrin repeat domain-containing protein n=1 Tax=Streptomyces sp. NBC_01465 TaxID=2903878 RepID=UPI002E3665A0|nr:ankyrin repeat domain-containing protein [Streptomyces sp. NBC_01465]
MNEDALVAAVRSGDAEAVGALLEGGADPDTVDEQGVPVLCLAVAAYDSPVTDALMNGGADANRPLPNGETPLLQAIDGGSNSLASRLLGDPARLSEATRTQLLDRARHWHEAGVINELRRRTGISGPPGRIRVSDRYWYTDHDELTLGGLTVRDGHAAILTDFEAGFGIRTPFGELLARALAHPDPEHADWSSVRSVLGRRQDEETWAAAAELRHHPDPTHRLFAADVLWYINFVDLNPLSHSLEPKPYEQRGLEVFLPWAVEETDRTVLLAVLHGLNDFDDPRAEAVGLTYLTHPDPELRIMVPATSDTMTVLARDADPGIRRSACYWLAEHGDHSIEVVDVLAELLHEGDQLTRIWAVYGLADRDDPRCVEGQRRVGPVDRKDWDDGWIIDAAERYERRRDGRR